MFFYIYQCGMCPTEFGLILKDGWYWKIWFADGQMSDQGLCPTKYLKS